jgi:hypothetical protein
MQHGQWKARISYARQGYRSFLSTISTGMRTGHRVFLTNDRAYWPFDVVGEIDFSLSLSKCGPLEV